ncbi:monooxygenase [Cladophialophora carrionii]|uniref:Monooxygenase n=2 Tax=Cladophialophora carrionii TaxID=86049 RepID=A0A1C1CGN8_9EURO|nr:monooxygenase [Cladophialophora carrionii]
MGSLAPESPLKVIIVGAGLGGCATALAMHHAGFEVVMFEKVREFQRLGDSLGLGENAFKLLDRWSPFLRDRLIEIGNKSEMMQIRRWHDGKLLAQQPLMDMAGYIGHRGDYHRGFLQAVAEKGIPLHMGAEVVDYDDTVPSVTLKDGTRHTADVVVAVDGIKSRARELVLGFDDQPKSSGYACFRAFFDGAKLQGNPVTEEFVARECVNIWIGKDMHCVQNTLRGGREFNWIITHKDTADVRESWSQPGDMDEVRRLVETLDPRIATAIRMTDECLDWKICYRDPIPTWVSKNHKVVLVGDCCHPHLPTSAQGASQATESAAVLAQCLLLAGRENVPLATRVYEKIRFPRVRRAQTNGEDLRDRWHSALDRIGEGGEIDPASLLIKNAVLYDYDAEADTRKRWPEMSALVSEELRTGNITPLC